MMRQIFAIIFMLMMVNVLGMPKTCIKLDIARQVTLKKGTALAVFHNISDKPVYLSYDNRLGEAHAGYSTEIKPQVLSMASLSKDFELNFYCVEAGYGYAQRVNCKQVLEVCSYIKRPKGMSEPAAFWLLENLPQSLMDEKLAALGAAREESTSIEARQ